MTIVFGRRRTHSRELMRYVRGVRVALPRAVLAELVASSGGLCFYCGADVSGAMEVDHVVPVARGGTSMLWNLVVACRTCNRKKLTLTGREFVPAPTRAQLARFDEIDRLLVRRQLGVLQRRRLRRAQRQRRREGARKRSELAEQKREERYRRQLEEIARDQPWLLTARRFRRR